MIDKQKRGRYRLYLALCLLFYVAAVLGYTSWSNHRHRHIILEELDQQLLLAAKALKFMLAPDFHDRAIDKDSISFTEELRNREAISGYADDTDFTYVYTLVEQEGKFYFSAPTVTEEEAKEIKLQSAYFEQLIDGLVYELYFPDEIKAACKEILPHLGELPPIIDTQSTEEKLAVIQAQFDRLYDPSHPVRNHLETLDSVEVVRIIREALKR